MAERPLYSILIEPLFAEDGRGFLATVPELPGCMSDGETEFEAIRNVQDAIDCWIEEATENERPIHLRSIVARSPSETDNAGSRPSATLHPHHA